MQLKVSTGSLFDIRIRVRQCISRGKITRAHALKTAHRFMFPKPLGLEFNPLY